MCHVILVQNGSLSLDVMSDAKLGMDTDTINSQAGTNDPTIHITMTRSEHSVPGPFHSYAK